MIPLFKNRPKINREAAWIKVAELNKNKNKLDVQSYHTIFQFNELIGVQLGRSSNIYTQCAFTYWEIKLIVFWCCCKKCHSVWEVTYLFQKDLTNTLQKIIITHHMLCSSLGCSETGVCFGSKHHQAIHMHIDKSIVVHFSLCGAVMPCELQHNMTQWNPMWQA